MRVTSLHQEPINSVPKRQFKRIKLTQKQMGDISAKVRAEVKLRSGGSCEIRKLCKGSEGVHMAHLTTRGQLTHKTTANDLKHACLVCHLWLDGKDGISYRNELRDLSASASTMLCSSVESERYIKH